MAAEPTWLEDMTKRVRAVERDEAGNVLTESYLNVCQGNLKVFALLFNGYFTATVGTQLAEANTNGQNIVRKDAAAIGADATTILGLVKSQMASAGAATMDVPGATSGTKSILWLNRELTFICKVIKLLSSGRPADEAGYEAYEAVLKPYHTWLLQKVVGNAVGYMEDLAGLMTALSIESKEEGKRLCEEFYGAMEPLVAEVLALLEAEGAHFQQTP